MGRNMYSHRNRGFTLIELMIVVVVIGILASIAYPSYQSAVERSRRSDGQAALLQAAQLLERCYTDTGSYIGCTWNDHDSPSGHYRITRPAADANSFGLTATPQGAQASDACGNLTLSHTGLRAQTGTGSRCWD